MFYNVVFLHQQYTNISFFLHLFHKAFRAQSGKWLDVFSNPLPEMRLPYLVAASTNAITIDDVTTLLDSLGGIQERFIFFDAYVSDSEFYVCIARPLLSLKTVGSMDCERVAKPMKNTIISKNRNRISDEKAVVLLRVSENLKHLQKVKQSVKDFSRNK